MFFLPFTTALTKIKTLMIRIKTLKRNLDSYKMPFDLELKFLTYEIIAKDVAVHLMTD